MGNEEGGIWKRRGVYARSRCHETGWRGAGGDGMVVVVVELVGGGGGFLAGSGRTGGPEVVGVGLVGLGQVDGAGLGGGTMTVRTPRISA